MPPTIFPLKGRRVFVAGHRGMVGSALVRRLMQEECELLTLDRDIVDLRNQAAVDRWFGEHRPEAVLLAAARVGGIHENDIYPGDFLYDNLAIATNVIEASRRAGIAKLLFLGSSCIYPRLAPQPISESCLLTGPLEPTNEAYAIAKIAGVKLCQAFSREYGANFISAMPTNLYGPNDNFGLETSHVLAALLRKTHDANKSRARDIAVWGTGTPRRHFLPLNHCASSQLF